MKRFWRWYRRYANAIALLVALYEFTMGAFTGKLAYWIAGTFCLLTWYMNYEPNNFVDRFMFRQFDRFEDWREARRG